MSSFIWLFGGLFENSSRKYIFSAKNDELESYRAPRSCSFRQECHKGRKVEPILGILGVIFWCEGSKILEGAKSSFFQLKMMN